MGSERAYLEAADNWRALLAHWPGQAFTIGRDNRLTSIGQSSGLIDAARDLGRDLFELVSPEQRAPLSAALAATRSGDESALDNAQLLLSGDTGRCNWRFIRLTDGRVMVVSVDVTHARAAGPAVQQSRVSPDADHDRMASRLRLLVEASQDFTDATGDFQRLFTVIANRLGAAVGDLCAVRALSTDGSMLERGAVYHRDPEISARAASILIAQPKSVHGGMMGKVARSGDVVFMPQVSTAEYAASSPTPEYRELLEQLRIGSAMMVPLSYQNQVMAVAALLRSGSDNPYTLDDLNLVRSVAEYAALAICNARSHQAERAALGAVSNANEALRKSEVAHRLLFEASPVPVLVFDVTTFEFLAANDAAVQLYGFTQEELLQMTLADLRRPEEREQVHTVLSTAGAREVVGSTWHRRKNGTEFRAEYQSRVFDFGGRRARIAVMTDVSARHEADRMRALLGAIVRSSNDAIVSKSLDGTITSWNAAAERLFGHSAAEAIGQSINFVIPSELLTEERELLSCIAGGDRVEHYETVRKRKDGSLVHVSLSLAPIFDPAGKVIGASKTARDLTAQREAAAALRGTEEQLRQAQKMEAVGRLAGGIAHDFNNVLSVILGHSGLILADLKANDPLCEDITEIQAAGLRAAALTRQLLMFSRQQVIAPRVIDLNEILLGMDKMVQRLVGEDVDLVSRPGANLGRIHADPSNVDQVIMNLVVNARDAMPRGGKITIETGNVELDEEYARAHLGARPGPHVMLAVSDNGSGMDAATQARIFEPFFTTKAQGKGTGLGLSTVFGIVQQSGGTVWVYSELGAGTTFKVYLPRVEDELDTADAPLTRATSRGRETVLLVEDQDQVRAVARGILKRNGYHVLVARRPGEALLICEQHEGCIDLLVTDVVMPQLSGVEMAKRMASLRPRMKVLYMSGYTDDSIVRHGVLESEMAFLQKPFTPESLTGKVREIIDDSRPARQPLTPEC
jgi:two-component system, cell cycle sensor histidine kinase and response regulator CckA